MPVGGNTVVCSLSGISSYIPICGADKGCDTASALQLTSGATSTTCSQKMANQQACVAVCRSSARVEGTIKCISGRLVDSSHCVSAQDVIPIKMLKVFGTVFIGLTGMPTSASVTKAIADAFLTHPNYVSVASDAFPSSDGRLLAARQRTPLRFLSSVITVQYTVAIKPNREQHSSSALSNVMALSTPNSASGQAFSQSMKGSGVTVLSLVYFNRPVIVTDSVVLQNAGGTIQQFDASPTREIKTMLTTNEDLGVLTILAVVFSSLLFLSSLAWLGRTCSVMRSRFADS